MRTAIAAKLCLGLLLLALLLPSQIYSQNTTIAPSTSNNTSVSTTVLPTTKQTQNTNTTTTGSGNSLQSTAGLFIFSFSLLHLYC